MQQLAPRRRMLSGWEPFARYSLGEIMIRISADELVTVGEQIQEGKLLLDHLNGVTISTDASRQEMFEAIYDMCKFAETLEEPVIHDFLQAKVDVFEHAPPQHWEDMEGYADLFKAMLQKRLFLYVPNEHARYWQNHELLSEKAKDSFPVMAHELLSAGNAYACGLSTACVFHCMRAVESGLRAMAENVGIVWTKEQWHTIIASIESKIEAIRKAPNNPQRSAQLHAMSIAAKEFYYFKDGWRNYVSHGKASYEQPQASEIMTHVRAFSEHLAEKVGLYEMT